MRARALGEDRAALSLQPPRARIGIHAHDEHVAFGLRRLQIAHVAHVEQIEDAVGEDDLAAGAAVLRDQVVKAAAGKDFVARVHLVLCGCRMSGHIDCVEVVVESSRK